MTVVDWVVGGLALLFVLAGCSVERDSSGRIIYIRFGKPRG